MSDLTGAITADTENRAVALVIRMSAEELNMERVDKLTLASGLPPSV